jgi:hypothetical protein|tara:strand:+ start:221 stop:382 length:162 start_codon:yes stop_codon:yes gene_type:complete
MAVKFKGKDFTKLNKAEVDEFLRTKIYLKPKKVFELNKENKFVEVKKKARRLI